MKVPIPSNTPQSANADGKRSQPKGPQRADGSAPTPPLPPRELDELVGGAPLQGANDLSPGLHPRMHAARGPDPAFKQLLLWGLRSLSTRPAGERVVELARHFKGRPYVEGGLEQGGQEILRARLDAFDCVTFVETLAALDATIGWRNESSMQAFHVEDGWKRFTAHLQDIRYRDGKIDGYPSRLHYSTWAIQQGVREGRWSEVAEQIPESLVSERKIELRFMGQHPDAYPVAAETLRQMESSFAPNSIEQRFIAQEDIRSSYAHLQAGDLVFIVTNVEGLDYAHAGVITKLDDEHVGLIHASSSKGVRKVVEVDDLATYIQSNKIQIGITPLRLRD